LDFVFVDEFLDDKLLDFFDSFSRENKLEFVEESIGLSIIKLNEEGTGVLVRI
jgi:hypothetical protein